MIQFEQKLITRWAGLPVGMQRRYVFAVIAACALAVVGVVYVARMQMDVYVQAMQQLIKATLRSNTLLDDFAQINKEEQRMRALLDKNRDFMIKSFFEQFCQQQKLTAESGWDAHAETVNDQFDRVVLTATFKNLTMEKVVGIIQAVEQDPIVYIKDLVITSQPNRTVSCDIALATQRYRVTT